MMVMYASAAPTGVEITSYVKIRKTLYDAIVPAINYIFHITQEVSTKETPMKATNETSALVRNDPWSGQASGICYQCLHCLNIASCAQCMIVFPCGKTNPRCC